MAVHPLKLIAERFSTNLQKNQSSPQIAAFLREPANVTSDSPLRKLETIRRFVALWE
jgi:hypothetical protein